MRKHLIFIAVIALVAVFAFGALGTSPASAAGTYTVQPGDSLFSIAARFNVSISQLATINKIYDVNTLNVGQVLLLPDPIPGASGQSPIVITSNYGITGTTYQPAYTTPIYTPPVVTYPGGTTVTTVTTYTSYVVRPGDFLSAIADRFGTTPGAILSANAIANPNLLYVGQWLTIPHTRTNVSPPVVRVAPRINYGSGRVYIVQPGDILFGIAARFGRNVYSIAQANGILDLNAIYVGEPLLIP